MPITRTPIIDDDGTGTTGTVLDNAWKQQLYDQIDGVAGEPPWTAYAPIWGATLGGTPPSGGVSTIAGTYATRGGLTNFEIYLTVGAGTNLGISGWTFSVPFPFVIPAQYRGFLVLAGRAYNQANGASVAIAGGVMISASAFEFYTGAGNVSASVPFAFTPGCIVQVSGIYRSA